jgi:hypothetical protein
MICVARKARRVSSKLWHGRKDDEYLGFWDTFVPSAFWASAARKPDPLAKTRFCSCGCGEVSGLAGRDFARCLLSLSLHMASC